MNSVTLNENQIDFDRSMASPIDDRNVDDYRYEAFHAALNREVVALSRRLHPPAES